MHTFLSQNVRETAEAGEALGKKLRPGDVVAFIGGLGMGKTAFVSGLARGMGITLPISSPTYALVNEYKGDLTLYHFDMYRVSSWEDLYSTGFFDDLDAGGVLAVEWSENIAAALPEHTIYVEISAGNQENERQITITGGYPA